MSTKGAADVTFEGRLHAALHAHVLSHLDLGADAASLFDSSLPAKPWVPALLEAYRRAPGRLAIQFLPLHTADLAEVTELLRRGPPAGLRDDAGRLLLERLGDAMEAELPGFEEDWHAAAEEAAARRERLAGELREPLRHLREKLWARVTRSAPPLRVLDCPALGSRARGMGLDRGADHLRVVAASLHGPWQQVLCRIFHEEVHPVSDPAAWAPFAAAGQARDTRAGTAGHRVHVAVERAAVELGAQVVAEHAPELMGAYCEWREGARSGPRI